jgi:hypothetical protein
MPESLLIFSRLATAAFLQTLQGHESYQRSVSPSETGAVVRILSAWPHGYVVRWTVEFVKPASITLALPFGVFPASTNSYHRQRESSKTSSRIDTYHTAPGPRRTQQPKWPGQTTSHISSMELCGSRWRLPVSSSGCECIHDTSSLGMLGGTMF